ncbi:hypothetical protein ABE527_07370 [Brucella sp. TWI432]
MKKISIAILTLTLSAGAAYAENPFVGEPPAMAAQDKLNILPGNPSISAMKRDVDYTAPASINSGNHNTSRANRLHRHDGSAHRFGDASPASYPQGDWH